MSTKLQHRFNRAVIEMGDPHDYVVAIGYEDGTIEPRHTIERASTLIYEQSVLWFEIRPFSQPFQPDGYTRATNPEWDLLQTSHDYDVECALNNTRGDVMNKQPPPQPEKKTCCNCGGRKCVLCGFTGECQE